MSGIHRLDAKAPKLASYLGTLDAQSLRNAARAVVRLAIERTGVAGGAIGRGLEGLESSSYEDEQLRGQVTALVEALDEEQWNLQDRVEGGTATEEEQIVAFSRARAANSLLEALGPDPLSAAREAVYECLAAVDDEDAVMRVVIAAG